MKLRELRKAKGISQAELAHQCWDLGTRLRANDITSFETGYRRIPISPHSRIRLALAAVLGVQPEEIE